MEYLTPDECEWILDLFKTDQGVNPSVEHWIGNRLYFSDSESSQELMFRFCERQGLKGFKIARIGFNRQRQGHGTKLLQFLTQAARSKGLTAIWVESALTEGMIAFCQKHDFQPVEQAGYWLEDAFYGDWVLELKTEKGEMLNEQAS